MGGDTVMANGLDLETLPDRVIVALTIFGEARGEPVEGQIAVGCVIRNRFKAQNNQTAKWGAICLAPKQFSCFNPTDPNFAVVQRAASTLLSAFPPPMLHQAEWLADGILSGAALDVTHGATHYLTRALYASPACPSWAQGKSLTTMIGGHVFLAVA